MNQPKPTGNRDSKGRLLWQKWCKTCAKPAIVRYEGVHKLCRSCVKAQGKGFPPGTLIDPEDAWLARFSWSLNNSGYLKGPGGELHRIVMQAKPGQEVHHKNHNKLDCRKSNLQFISHSANIQAYWDRKKGRVKERDIDFF